MSGVIHPAIAAGVASLAKRDHDLQSKHRRAV